jgi:hypothetical protein
MDASWRVERSFADGQRQDALRLSRRAEKSTLTELPTFTEAGTEQIGQAVD